MGAEGRAASSDTRSAAGSFLSVLQAGRQAHRSPSPWPGLRRVAGHRPSLCTGPANCPVSLWPSPSSLTWGLHTPGEGPGVKAKSPYEPPITSHPPQAQVGTARLQNFCTETVHTHFQLTITVKNVAHGSYRRFLERSRNPDTYMRAPLLKSSIVFSKPAQAKRTCWRAALMALV